ncbi:hypothetical protein [Paenibacillus foliorum]|uniref:hypothetical protein n=1 Tax=Paenibacillus foliorum TaxID=2654974 RepID=UPI00149268A1|nr:hypothetical protein [Paenibacillus foliorum]
MKQIFFDEHRHWDSFDEQNKSKPRTNPEQTQSKPRANPEQTENKPRTNPEQTKINPNHILEPAK